MLNKYYTAQFSTAQYRSRSYLHYFFGLTVMLAGTETAPDASTDTM
jgi:hypothetical protein